MLFILCFVCCAVRAFCALDNTLPTCPPVSGNILPNYTVPSGGCTPPNPFVYSFNTTHHFMVRTGVTSFGGGWSNPPIPVATAKGGTFSIDMMDILPEPRIVQCAIIFSGLQYPSGWDTNCTGYNRASAIQYAATNSYTTCRHTNTLTWRGAFSPGTESWDFYCVRLVIPLSRRLYFRNSYYTSAVRYAKQDFISRGYMVDPAGGNLGSLFYYVALRNYQKDGLSYNFLNGIEVCVNKPTGGTTFESRWQDSIASGLASTAFNRFVYLGVTSPPSCELKGTDLNLPNLSREASTYMYVQWAISGFATSTLIVLDASHHHAVYNPVPGARLERFSKFYTDKLALVNMSSWTLSNPYYDWRSSRGFNGTSGHMAPVYWGKAVATYIARGSAYISDLIPLMYYNTRSVCTAYTNVLGRYCPAELDCCLGEGIESWFVDYPFLIGSAGYRLLTQMGHSFTGLDMFTDKLAFLGAQHKLFEGPSYYYHSVAADGSDFTKYNILNIQLLSTVLQSINGLPVNDRFIDPDYYSKYLGVGDTLMYDTEGTLIPQKELDTSLPYTVYNMFMLGVLTQHMNSTQIVRFHTLARILCPTYQVLERNLAFTAICAIVNMGQCKSCDNTLAPEVVLFTSGMPTAFKDNSLITFGKTYSYAAVNDVVPANITDFGFNVTRPFALCIYEQYPYTVFSGPRCIAHPLLPISASIAKHALDIVSVDMVDVGFMVMSRRPMRCSGSLVASAFVSPVFITLLDSSVVNSTCEVDYSNVQSAQFSVIYQNTTAPVSGYTVDFSGRASLTSIAAISAINGVIKVDSSNYASTAIVLYAPAVAVCNFYDTPPVTSIPVVHYPFVYISGNRSYSYDKSKIYFDDPVAIQVGINFTIPCTYKYTPSNLNCSNLACGDDLKCLSMIIPFCLSVKPLIDSVINLQTQLDIVVAEFTATMTTLQPRQLIHFTNHTRFRRSAAVAGAVMGGASLVVDIIGFAVVGWKLDNLQQQIMIQQQEITAIAHRLDEDFSRVNSRLTTLNQQIVDLATQVRSQFALVNQNFQAVTEALQFLQYAQLFISSFTTQLHTTIISYQQIIANFASLQQRLYVCTQSLDSGYLSPSCGSASSFLSMLEPLGPTLYNVDPTLLFKHPIVSFYTFQGITLNIGLLVPKTVTYPIYSSLPVPIGNTDRAQYYDDSLVYQHGVFKCILCIRGVCFSSTTDKCIASVPIERAIGLPYTVGVVPVSYTSFQLVRLNWCQAEQNSVCVTFNDALYGQPMVVDVYTPPLPEVINITTVYNYSSVINNTILVTTPELLAPLNFTNYTQLIKPYQDQLDKLQSDFAALNDPFKALQNFFGNLFGMGWWMYIVVIIVVALVCACVCGPCILRAVTTCRRSATNGGYQRVGGPL